MTHRKFHRKLAALRIKKNAEYRRERRAAFIKAQMEYNARPFEELFEESIRQKERKG